MKIKLLIQREPFFEILNKTIQKFWTKKYKKTVSLKVVAKSKIIFGNNVLFGNSNLNVIFHPKTESCYFHQIKSEFSYHLNPFRRFFQTVYSNFALVFPFSIVFSDIFIQVNGDIAGFKKKIIIGGNHKIRILDYKQNISYIILKEGFNSSFLKNEIELRNNFTDEAIPKLFEIDPEQTWFSEEIISGKPINRLNNKRFYLNALENAVNTLNKLYNQTKQNIDSYYYVKKLTNKVNSLLQANFFESIEVDILKIINILQHYILDQNSFTLIIVKSHGDFQPANILLNQAKIWLIDWENATERMMEYDIFTFALKARNLNVFENEFLKVYNGEKFEFEINLGLIHKNINVHLREKLIIFLIENLIFALEQNNNVMFYKRDDYLLKYLDILQNILKKS